MVRNLDLRSSFRCAIAPEDGAAMLKINGKLYPCHVVNTSREGFGVVVPSQIADRLKKRSKLELIFRNENWEVSKSWDFHENDGKTSLGLVRIRELSKPKVATSWGFSVMPNFSSNTDPSFLMALLVAFVVTCLCLPGIGDNIGTAPKVRKGVNTMMKHVKETFH